MLVIRRAVLGLTLTSALVLCAASANAADIYYPEGGLKDGPVYVPANTWAGFYIGANGGFAWSGEDTANLTVFGSSGTTGPLHYRLDESGGFGGGQIGYNLQHDHVVFGVEADFQGAGIGGSSKTSFPSNFPASAAFIYEPTKDVEWFGTARGRLGYAFDRTLVYATGGFAFGRVAYKANYIFDDPTCCTGSFGRAKASDTATGFAVGGGIEQAISPNWSLKAEYQFIDLGTQDVTGALFFSTGLPSGETFKTKFGDSFHTVRVGLNYHFNRDYEPLK